MARQERALRTREALIKSAAAVFDREGFSVASLTTISSQAGVSNGALHFHFASKAALATAVEDAAARKLGDITTDRRDETGSALQSLVDATHDLVRRLGDDVVLRAGFELSGDQVRASGRSLRRQWQQWVEGTLKQAEGEGALNEAIAPEEVAIAVVAATTGFEVLGMQDPEWLSDRTLTCFWDLLLPRIAAAPVLGGLAAGGSDRARPAPEEPEAGCVGENRGGTAP